MPTKFVSTLSDYKLQYLKEFEQRNKHLSIPAESLFKVVENTLSQLQEPITWADFKSYYDGSHWQKIEFPDDNERLNKIEVPQKRVDLIPEPTRTFDNSYKTTDLEKIYSAAYENFRDRKYHIAEKGFKRCIELEYKLESCYELLGRLKFETERHTDAIEFFTESIKLHPYNCQIYAMRGLAKDMLGDKKGYINDLEKAKQVYSLNHPSANVHSEEMDKITFSQCGKTFVENCDFILALQRSLVYHTERLQIVEDKIKAIGISLDQGDNLFDFFEDYSEQPEKLSTLHKKYISNEDFIEFNKFKDYFLQIFLSNSEDKRKSKIIINEDQSIQSYKQNVDEPIHENIINSKTSINTNKIEKKNGSTLGLTFGFIFSLLGGFIGTGFGLNYAFGGYSKSTKILGWIMIVLGIIMSAIFKNL